MTSEESLTLKANYAREMAKAVNSAQFRRKRLQAQKQAPKNEEKDKVGLFLHCTFSFATSQGCHSS